MESYQIILLAFVALIIFLKFKRSIATRSLNNYSVSEVKEIMRCGNSSILLDVRTAGERKAGSIKGSIHIPLHEIDSNADQLKKLQSREIICFCQSGSRSVSAALKLKKLGYNSANMTGGFRNW